VGQINRHTKEHAQRQNQNGMERRKGSLYAYKAFWAAQVMRGRWK
jgi:hypothetical protein